MNDRQTNPAAQTILVIDDESANLKLLVDSLTGAGYRVLIAQNGERGLTRARHTHPDLILLDVVLPDISGFTLCEQLQQDEETQEIPIIFLTALTVPEDKIRAFLAGGVDYITKPFQWEEVLARVTMHLHMQELIRKVEIYQKAELPTDQENLQARIAHLEEENESLQKRYAMQEDVLAALRESEARWRAIAEASL